MFFFAYCSCCRWQPRRLWCIFYLILYTVFVCVVIFSISYENFLFILISFILHLFYFSLRRNIIPGGETLNRSTFSVECATHFSYSTIYPTTPRPTPSVIQLSTPLHPVPTPLLFNYLPRYTPSQTSLFYISSYKYIYNFVYVNFICAHYNYVNSLLTSR